jgi:hypothetical protein
MAVFARTRFQRRKWPVPSSFVWVGFGILSALFSGVGILAYGQLPIFTALLLKGLVTSLLMGIGGQLIPRFTGVISDQVVILSTTESKDILQQRKNVMKANLLFATLFFVGLCTESLMPSHATVGAWLQALSLLLPILILWKLYRLPVKGARSVAVWISSWALPLGFILSALKPELKIHLMHITYIGSFSACTLAVGSHVSVSHRGLNQKLLKTVWPLGVIIGLIWVAALTRVSVPFVHGLRHLAYASMTAIIGIIIWFWFFVGGEPQKQS